jgi:2-methylisocitrate lyase-like PEP mutase family enzyme
MPTQSQKGELFHNLHHRDRAFIIPNPWDVGSAKLLAHLGFEALATTSAGYAFSTGRPDGTLGREESIAHAAAIVAATDLPVSADLENGFGDDPESAAETIRQAAAAGLAGASIEDVSGHGNSGPYEIGLAAERIRAAVEVVRGLPFRFTLTARAENYLVGRPDLKDTIARLQAFQEAGADVLYAPGLTTKEDISAVVRAVDRPVNVIMGLQGAQLSLGELSALGVKRISLGSALARAAFGAFLRAAREMHDRGTFEFASEAVTFREITAMFEAIHPPQKGAA